MLVIGAGLPRTGTGSLHRAISLLGYRSYHMMSVLGDDAHAKQWADLADGAASFNDTAQFISRQAYNATLDYPTSDYVAEYLQLYPDAKVILSVRDNATAWAQSYQLLNRLVLTMERSFTWTYPNWIPLLIPEKAANIRKMRCILGTNTVNLSRCELIFVRGQDLEYLRQHYEKHNARIREIVPPEQLLEFNVKQGWKPLCDFLGHPAPHHAEFPHMGESNQLRLAMLVCVVVTYLWIPTVLAIVLLIFKRCCGFGCRRKNEQKTKQS